MWSLTTSTQASKNPMFLGLIKFAFLEWLKTADSVSLFIVITFLILMETHRISALCLCRMKIIMICLRILRLVRPVSLTNSKQRRPARSLQIVRKGCSIRLVRYIVLSLFINRLERSFKHNHLSYNVRTVHMLQLSTEWPQPVVSTAPEITFGIWDSVWPIPSESA